MKIQSRKIVIVAIGLSLAFVIACIPFTDIKAGEIEKTAVTGAISIISMYLGAGGVKDGNKKQGEQ